MIENMNKYENLNFAVVIPARYQSSRFPGKPLALICNKPMIQHVWEKCCEAVGEKKVYIATDDSRISNAADKFNAQVIMTDTNCLTGTDRLADANLKLKCDFIVNVQGDEPLINPKNIISVISKYLEDPNNVVNAMCEIHTEDEFRSFNVPKLVVNSLNELLYISRSPIPVSKENKFDIAYKQVCIYAFSKKHLEFFKENNKKTQLEQIEDIEILRFLENKIEINMVLLEDSSLAVDVPEDIKKVEDFLNDY